MSHQGRDFNESLVRTQQKLIVISYTVESDRSKSSKLSCSMHSHSATRPLYVQRCFTRKVRFPLKMFSSLPLDCNRWIQLVPLSVPDHEATELHILFLLQVPEYSPQIHLFCSLSPRARTHNYNAK